MIISVLFRWTLRETYFFIEFPCVLITVVEIDISAVNINNFSNLKAMNVMEFSTTIWFKTFLSLKEDSLRDTWIFFFFFIDGNWVIFQVKHYLNFSVSWIFWVALNNAFLKETIESQDMTIKSNPIWLIEFRSIFRILSREVIMGCRDKNFTWFLWFWELFLSWENVLSLLNVIHITVELLFLSTHFSVILFEFLSGSKPRQQWVVRSHNVTYIY